MRRITEIIIHCAATKPRMHIGVKEIDRWHRERGWDCIGYHYVIRRTGKLEHGRPEGFTGAHCKGKNASSIGVCLVGGLSETGEPENNFTPAQFGRLAALLRELCERYPEAMIYPHSAFADKACPCFDVPLYLQGIGLAGKDGQHDV